MTNKGHIQSTRRLNNLDDEGMDFGHTNSNVVAPCMAKIGVRVRVRLQDKSSYLEGFVQTE